MNAPTLSPAAKLHDLLTKFTSAMLISLNGGGQLHGRPMVIAHVDDDCQLWFFTSLHSGKVSEIEGDSQVAVICQKGSELFLSLSGEASITRNAAKISEFWKESFRTWFPDGQNDPEISLVQVRPIIGEYWDNDGFNKIKYLFETAHAYATGRKPVIEDGEEHAKVQLS